MEIVTPVVQAVGPISIAVTLGLTVGSAILISASFFGSIFIGYVIVWALAAWGEIDGQIVKDYEDVLFAWTYENPLFQPIYTVLLYPVNQIRYIFWRASEDANYNVEEEPYLVGFFFTSFPVIYLAGAQLSVFNLALTPILIGLYLADTSLFIDKVETLANGDYYPRPAQGPPTWWSEYYAVLSLQWGDYAIFSPKWMPEIELL